MRNKLGAKQLRAYEVIRANGYLYRIGDLKKVLDHFQSTFNVKYSNGVVSLKELNPATAKVLVEHLNNINHRWEEGRKIVINYNLGKRWYGPNSSSTEDRVEGSGHKQVERLNAFKDSFITCNKQIIYMGKNEYFNYIHKNEVVGGWFTQVIKKIKKILS